MSAARSGHVLGVVLVLVAALCGSTAGVILRHIEAADGWQILFYRSISFAALVFIVIAVRHGRGTAAAFVAIGRPGLIAAVCLGVAFLAYVIAMLLTTVADAVFILSAAPFVAAVLGWLTLRESVGRVTLIGMVVALAGIAVMVSKDVAGGSLAGAMVAFVACFGYAACVVALRAAPDTDMMPAVCLAGVVAFVISLVFVGGDLSISPRDLGLSVLLGTGQIGLQYILISLAARTVPAAEITLLMLLEVVLAPFWVWIAVGEEPSALTLAGGGIVLAALLYQALAGLRQSGSG